MIEPSELRSALSDLRKRLSELREYLKLDQKSERVSELEDLSAAPNFWDNPAEAQKTLQELTTLKDQIEKVEKMAAQESELSGLLEMAVEENEEELLEEIQSGVAALEKGVDELELTTMLCGEYDNSNVYLTIHPGAGGTESQDWAEMLLRMYVRWAERHGFKVEFMEYQEGDEAGIKSATLYISGENAFGYLRSEKGVHRLVRISPFDASGRRHTSFVSVDIVPDIEDQIEVEIRPEDLKIDTYRSSGAGGQHVNKTESAVRITHIPTGIVVACQNERSQFQNRDRAMNMLKAKLYEYQRQQQEAKMAQIKGEYSEIAWGNQIRSYVFCPYTMVKDHRTEAETGNV
ncbi:MAG TPA: peptide chain release factor 2, partial [Bacillota bacterium]|nr:peptide chain release factor 2 [Bacillota bacterium]